MYLPPHSEVWGIADSTSLVRDVRMKFDRPVVETLLGEDWDRKKWNEPVLMLYDEPIRQIAELIWQECHVEPEEQPLYREHLTMALLARLFQSQRIEKKTSPSGLGRQQFKRTIEYMRSNLLRDLRLRELASVAGPLTFAIRSCIQGIYRGDATPLDHSTKDRAG